MYTCATCSIRPRARHVVAATLNGKNVIRPVPCFVRVKTALGADIAARLVFAERTGAPSSEYRSEVLVLPSALRTANRNAATYRTDRRQRRRRGRCRVATMLATAFRVRQSPDVHVRCLSTSGIPFRLLTRRFLCFFFRPTRFLRPFPNPFTTVHFSFVAPPTKCCRVNCAHRVDPVTDSGRSAIILSRRTPVLRTMCHPNKFYVFLHLFSVCVHSPRLRTVALGST